MKNIVVIGGSFAGLTAALELKRKGGQDFHVTVVDKSPVFLFVPSLIWVPFRRRDIKDITIRRDEILKKKGIDFLHGEAINVDPDAKVVHTSKGDLPYDELIVATGPKVDFNVAPGVAEYAHYIGSPDGAMKIRKALEEFKQNPGPIVVGATQGAGCMGAAYEFLFNLEKWLREQGIRKKVDLTWITPENYLGHFGIDGITGGETMLKGFMKMFNIHFRTEVGVKEMTRDHIELTSGEKLPYAFSMLMPPFHGVDFVKNSPKLEPTPTGYLAVGGSYQHPKYPNVWAAGIAVDVKPPFEPGCVPFGAPKTGYPSDETGKVVANNVMRSLQGKPLKEKKWGEIAAMCVMDAGKKEVLILGNKTFKPRAFAIMLPNIFYDFTKVFLEKYFLWKTRKGLSYLP
ncbi:MAG: FAD-dependent oxidoreductase [Bacteroidota bacterium]|nr:FAD-dependent oxidoreductase [Bacteroidota bacterium]MDX5427610.1 FAD-dependent oxidoreductase [Bacteroidota bacterium]MDX5448643.1 FAD-dependent oxidoreductase [Bacteroidota bacterium]MDX5505515.1 FAD-dependent oxidoreductase [Bacteroidota bacterium]